AAPDIIEYRLRVARAAQTGARLDFLARERLAKEFMELAGLIHDVTRRNAFIGDVAAQLDLSEAQLRRLVHLRPTTAPPSAPVSATPTMTVRREEEFLRVLLEDDAFVSEARAALTAEDFEEPLHQRMFATLAERTAAGIRATSPSDLGPDPEQIARWSLILSRPFEPAGAERIFADGMKAFRHRQDQADRPRIKEMIAAAERSGDTDTASRLLEQFNRSWRSEE
ncbi:MAG: hypothetical protein HY304_05060, partial [candidate division Zixibacteria bacterium]|nr:hypothetical protein [candidate division Zixibacteria bacterium]